MHTKYNSDLEKVVLWCVPMRTKILYSLDFDQLIMDHNMNTWNMWYGQSIIVKFHKEQNVYQLWNANTVNPSMETTL